MVFLSIIFAYLLGSISPSFIAGKIISGVDIRDLGSGNAGATNALRVLGWRVGFVVLLSDMAKGVLAVALAHLLTNGQISALALAGLAAIIGHNWPIYFGFRGGKGISTTIGVLLTLTPVPVLYAVLVAVALLLLLRFVSLSSLSFVTLTPLFQIMLHSPAIYIWIAVLIAIMAFWRHRSNISRLLHGRENRITFR